MLEIKEGFLWMTANTGTDSLDTLLTLKNSLVVSVLSGMTQK